MIFGRVILAVSLLDADPAVSLKLKVVLVFLRSRSTFDVCLCFGGIGV